MKKTANSMSNIARSNKTAMRAHLIDVAVMATFCFLQAAGGLQPWSYVLVIALLGFVPVIIEYFCWRRNHETRSIKPVMAIGFFIFYTYALFTSSNQFVFVFAIPMILVASVFNDVKYSLLLNICAVLESLILVIAGSQTGKFGYLGSDYAIIQVVIVILIGIYALFTTQTINQNFNQVLANLSSLSEEMKSGIIDINTELAKLSGSSKSTRAAMQEVSTGTSDTADAVQNQLLQTQSIGQKTDAVYTSIQQISENMQQTLAALYMGNENVSSLVQKVDASVENGISVTAKLETLEHLIEEMNSITELIGSIAKQSNLLSLNARIEASRAGESGKGFAVVASEFSDMAAQTADATTHIDKLIGTISSGLHETMSVIQQMIDGINEEKTSTERTAASFDSIQENTLSIRDHVELLTRNMEELKNANYLIADSTQTISAVSEEVSAHAAETMTAEERNEELLGQIHGKMQGLVKLTE